MVCLPTVTHAQVVLAGRLTTTTTGEQFNAGSQDASISPDGRYIAFVSSSSNIGQPSNGSLNVYRYDLVTDEYLLATPVLGGGNSNAPSISEGGLSLAFESQADNLAAAGNPSGFSDVFYSYAYDAGQGAIAFDTYLVSQGVGGAVPNGASQNASISGNGLYVAFLSYASNLIDNDTNVSPDIFVSDAATLFAGQPERVSVNNGGAQINGYSRALSPSAISSDGRFVAFAVDTPVSIDGSNAGTLEDVFVRDRTLGMTSLISKSTAGVAGSNSSDEAAISPSGRYVVFRSFSTNLVANRSGSLIYVRDRQNETTTNMPLPPGADSCEDPRISDLGDIVAQCNMPSPASQQAFLYDPAGDGAFYRLSTSLTDTNGNGTSGGFTGISADGGFMVFDSVASDLVPDDTNSAADVFGVIPEPDAASGCLVAIAALAVAARRRGKRRSRRRSPARRDTRGRASSR
jgi:Tol biopolymer transport system component